MNESNYDQLDQMLRDWGDRHAADSQSLERIREATWQALESDGEPRRNDLTSAAAPAHGRIRAWWFSVGAVAALLLVILSYTVWLQSSSERPEIVQPSPPQDSDGVLAAITPEQLARDAKLFAEMDRLFGQQLKWVAESDGLVEMGIEPDVTVAGEPANSKPVTIRFKVARRRQGERDWDVIWSVKVLARSEQLVQLPPAETQAPSLLVWVFTLPDGKIACDTELSMSSEGLHVTASELQSAGEVRQVGSAEEDGVEYRVFQMVQLLDDEVI